jgi:hypothetical protein
MLRPLVYKKREPLIYVASFIDSTSATWKVDLLEEHFLPVGVEVIQSIPMNTSRMDNIWAWHYDKIGVLTVRSTYCLLVHTKRRREDWMEGRSTGSNSKRRISGSGYGRFMCRQS